ncbi:hypothetical protein D9M68_857020 [compost metagenome]
MDTAENSKSIIVRNKNTSRLEGFINAMKGPLQVRVIELVQYIIRNNHIKRFRRIIKICNILPADGQAPAL